MIQLRLPTAILSLGVTGQSVLRLLLEVGIPRSQILLFDTKDPGADFRDPQDLLKKNPQSLIVPPGIPLGQSWIQSFRKGGGQITSELEIAASFLTAEKVLGVTGAIGKSTCASLLQAGLEKFSPDSFVGGNLGVPLADYALRKIRGGATAEWIALELSSYQLENFANLSCDGAIVTYLTPNHMERYPDLETYYRTKWFLVEKTYGPVVMNQNGGDLVSYAKGRADRALWTSGKDPRLADFDFDAAQLVGEHNRDNLALVTTLARALGWPKSAEAGFRDFRGLPHRLENLGFHDGVRWINDSKSTTIESVLQAVRSTAGLPRGKTHLLLGGKDKNLPWQDLSALANGDREYYFFGEVRERAQKLSGLPGSSFPRLKDAIEAARLRAREGDLILLSPGGTSWDEFKSFEERGDFFRNQISGH